MWQAFEREGNGSFGKGRFGRERKTPFPKTLFPFPFKRLSRRLFVRGLGLSGEDPGNEFRRFSSQCSTQLPALYCIQVFVFLMFYFLQRFRPFSFKSTMIQLKRRMKERIGQLVCSFTVRHGLCEAMRISSYRPSARGGGGGG